MSIYKHKKTGNWVVQVRDPRTGKKVQVGTYSTKGEALRAEEAQGLEVFGTMTVSEWRKVWLANPDWKESTRKHNEERTLKFNDEYGHYKLRAVNRRVARDWVTAAPSTHGALSSMFGAAEYEDDEHGNRLVVSNPFTKLVKKKTPKRDLPADWMPASAIIDMRQAARDALPGPIGEVMDAMIVVASETGARPGEIMALTLDKIDRANNRVRIDRAVVRRGNYIDTPKNGKTRDVVLSDAAIQAIDNCPRFADNEWVFQLPSGGRFTPSSFGYYWRPVKLAFGRPKMHFYELRHYCATRLLEAGLPPEDVAAQLGHTNGQLVREVYGHPSQRQALDRIQDRLNNDQGSNDHEDEGTDQRAA